MSINIFKKPLVSVILASYNHARFIREAVESVLNQTFTDFELLVLDDGSTDATPDIVAKIKDKRLKLVRLMPNRRFHPRNTGIKMSRGKYIAFQNSDDVWLKDKLRQQIEVLEKNRQVVVCFTRLEIINEKGKIIRKSWAYSNLPGKNINNGSWLRLLFNSGVNFGIGSAVTRKNKVVRLKGFCESMTQLSDYDLWVRLAGLGQFFIINKQLTKMRIIKNNNASFPKKEIIRKCSIENIDVLNRYTEWPVNQYLKFIFNDIMPKEKVSISIQYAALARFAWQLKTPHHSFFADQLVARLLNNPKTSKEVLGYFGVDLKKEYLKRRGKLGIVVYKK